MRASNELDALEGRVVLGIKTVNVFELESNRCVSETRLMLEGGCGCGLSICARCGAKFFYNEFDA